MSLEASNEPKNFTKEDVEALVGLVLVLSAHDELPSKIFGILLLCGCTPGLALSILNEGNVPLEIEYERTEDYSYQP